MVKMESIRIRDNPARDRDVGRPSKKSRESPEKNSKNGYLKTNRRNFKKVPKKRKQRGRRYEGTER